MARNTARSALLARGPWPGTILVLSLATFRYVSSARIMPRTSPPLAKSMFW